MKVLNNLLFTIYLLVLLTSCKKTTSNRYDITEFGATADTTILSTVAINKAVETCSNNGGGTVYVPTGTYYSGTIILKSNVTLYLETGAVIKGSRDTADYMINGKKYGLVFARNAKNIAIEGHGELNGNGTYFFDPTKPHLAGDFDKSYTRQGENFMDVKYGLEDGPIKYITRPGMMVVIMNCENVKITDVMLRDTPEWTVRFGDCDNVDVRGVSIFANQLVPNSDGIHCTNSRNVRISDCDIRCGDDAVIVSGFDQLIGVHGEIRKAEDEGILLGNKTGRSENIMVTNCTLESRSAGIRIGYGEHSIRNCVFSNLSIYNSNRGIGIFARDTANIENLQFSNILIQTRLHKGHWWGKGEPVHISSIQQKKEYPVGYVKNIYFQNVRIEGETGLVLYAQKPGLVENIVFNNLTVKIKKSPIDSIYGGNIDLRPTMSPATQIFKSDIPAVYVLNVNNLKMRDVEVGWDKNLASYFTHGIHAVNVTGGYIDNFSGTGATPAFKGIFLEKSDLKIK